MAEEDRTCPYYLDTKLRKTERCNGKFLSKEPIVSSEPIVGILKGPKDIRGARTGEVNVPYYIFECENGHMMVRPGWFADVPIVPPGTLKAKPFKDHPEWYIKNDEITNRPAEWYQKKSDEDKEKIWKVE